MFNLYIAENLWAEDRNIVTGKYRRKASEAKMSLSNTAVQYKQVSQEGVQYNCEQSHSTALKFVSSYGS